MLEAALWFIGATIVTVVVLAAAGCWLCKTDDQLRD